MVLICCKALAVVITVFLPLFDQCMADFLKGGSAPNLRECIILWLVVWPSDEFCRCGKSVDGAVHGPGGLLLHSHVLFLLFSILFPDGDIKRRYNFVEAGLFMVWVAYSYYEHFLFCGMWENDFVTRKFRFALLWNKRGFSVLHLMCKEVIRMMAISISRTPTVFLYS